MKKYLLMGSLLFIIPGKHASAQVNDPVPFYNGKDLWGFSDRIHHTIVAAKYTKVDDFNDGRAWVQNKEKCGFIDSKGREVIPLIFKSAENFIGGYSIVGNNDTYGVIDQKGNYLIPLSLKNISWFNGEVGRFDNNYIYGLAGKGGKIIVPAEYSSLEKFTETILIFSKNKNNGSLMLGKMGLMNTKGKILLEPKYDLIYAIPGGYAKIKQGALWGLIDTTGKELIPPVYEEIRSPKYGSYAGYKKDGKWGIIKFNGTPTVEPKYVDLGQGNSYFDEVTDYYTIGFKVYDGRNYGIVDGNGHEIIPLKYSMLGSSSNGITPGYKQIATTKNGLFITGLVFMDSSGKELIPPIPNYNKVAQYKEGVIAIGYGSSGFGKWKYVDLAGNQIVPGEYEDVKVFENGLAIVKKGGKFGVINKSGKEILPFRFKEISSSDNYKGLFKVKVNGLNQYYDDKGICFCKEE